MINRGFKSQCPGETENCGGDENTVGIREVRFKGGGREKGVHRVLSKHAIGKIRKREEQRPPFRKRSKCQREECPSPRKKVGDAPWVNAKVGRTWELKDTK